VAQLLASRASGQALLASSAATGLIATACERGGADLIVVYNSGRFRLAGRSSLSGLMPYANANTLALEMAREVLSSVKSVPIVVGLCGTDPFRDLEELVGELREMGVAGVQNFPTIGLFDAALRSELEATGICFEREVELIRAAARAGLLSCAFVTTPADARRMALAGADVIAPHLGVTRVHSGATLVSTATAIDEMAKSALALRDGLIVMFHGGPAATPEDVAQILELSQSADGFIAGSSIERFPIEAAVESATRRFALLRSRPNTVDQSTPAPDFSEPPPKLPIELDTQTLPDYLRERDIVLAHDDIHVEELGGGVSNVVLRWRTTDRCGVVKQSRPRLRVRDEWLSDVRRVLNERDAIAYLADRLPAGTVPSLTFSDDTCLVLGMECAPEDALVWKPLLLSGQLEPERARHAGELLSQIHAVTLDDVAAANRFVARPLLDQNRLDPWYRAAAAVHADLHEVFEYAIERLLVVRRVLVHGDYVPKNMLVSERGILVLDWEVVHFGNPGYDVATFINHMLLKGFRKDASRSGFVGMADAFWRAYGAGAPAGEIGLIEQEALLQLGILMLARVDGKSKVEYLSDESEVGDARAFGRGLLRARPRSLSEVFTRYVNACRAA
jgi:predicted TIM-barrel enzyme/aminoglycoside phosphotransferase (APT) family kinase protein